jgi:hypothetical protein
MSIQLIKDIFHNSYKMNVTVRHRHNLFHINYKDIIAAIPDDYTLPQEIVKPLLEKLMGYMGINQKYSKPDCLFHSETFPCFSGEKQYLPEQGISMTRFTDKKFGTYYYKYYTFDFTNGIWIEEKEHAGRIHALLSEKFKYAPTGFSYSLCDKQDPSFDESKLTICIPMEKRSLYMMTRVTDIVTENSHCSFTVEKFNYQHTGRYENSRSRYTASVDGENKISQQMVELKEPWWGNEVLSSNDLMQNPYNTKIHHMLEDLSPKYKSDNIWITYYDIFYIRLGEVWMPQSRFYVTTYVYVFPQHIQDELNILLSIEVVE